MRTIKLYITLIVASVALLNVGCGKDEKSNSSGIVPTYPGTGPYIPPSTINGPGTNPGSYNGINWEYGGTATLTVTSAALNSYVGYSVNNPTQIRINLNLQHYPGVATSDTMHSKKGEAFNGYGGTVTIAFNDGNGRYEDRFSSLVNPNGTVTTNAENNKYNKWRLVDGKWHGFFQDYYGAIIIVLDQVLDFGDGSAPQVGGEVWFKNHPYAPGPLSPTSCWFVSIGPYDCRTWKSGQGVNTEAALYPNGADGYQKLGRFSNLDAHKAFNSTTL